MVNLTRKILPGIARMIPVGHSQVNGAYRALSNLFRNVPFSFDLPVVVRLIHFVVF
jgi:hypothetical protein